MSVLLHFTLTRFIGALSAISIPLGEFVRNPFEWERFLSLGLSTYQSYYTQSLTGSSPSSISWIGSSQTFLLYFLGIISGPLSDRFGVRVSIDSSFILWKLLTVDMP